MSNETLPATQAAPAQQQGLIISYTPVGETEAITLTIRRVKEDLCIPTRSGILPTDNQVRKYMMLCKAQSLNPWVNDAFLVGYDSKDGPSFSLIVSHQALLKRAECSPEYDGIESGVIVKVGQDVIERPGKMTYDGEKLLGGWARVHRTDRKVSTYDSVNFRTYNTGRSRWAADPEGMIVKVAEAAALRKTFPSTLAAMYCQEEMERDRESSRIENVSTGPAGVRPMSRVEQVKASKTPATLPERKTEPAREAEPEVIDAVVSGVPPESNDAESLKRDRVARVNRIFEKEITDSKELKKTYTGFGVTNPDDVTQWADSELASACQYADDLEMRID
jgi:phage recombination protein Bet